MRAKFSPKKIADRGADRGTRRWAQRGTRSRAGRGTQGRAHAGADRGTRCRADLSVSRQVVNNKFFSLVFIALSSPSDSQQQIIFPSLHFLVSGTR